MKTGQHNYYRLLLHTNDYFFRLLDICHGQRLDREMVLYLVFEHVDQVCIIVVFELLKKYVD